MSVFTRLLSSSHGASITGSIEHLGGFNITGSIQANQADGSSSFQLTRNDTSIQTHDPIGDIIWSGMGPATGAPHTGAMITAVAAQDWTSSYQQGTDLKFRVQSNASGVDQLAAGAFLVLSGANGRAEFTGDVFTGNRLYSPNGVQIGPSTDGNLADQIGYPLRVSSDTGGVGIELDANGAGNTTSILFNYGGGAVTNKPGIFVSPNSAADFSIRKNSTAQENGAIMIDANMRSVRVGGGGFGTDAYDPAASLVVSASEANRNSWVMLRSRHDTVVTDNAPILTLDFKSNTGVQNTGGWHMGVSPHGTKPLRITGAAVGSSVIQDNTVAMTFNSAGASTSIGVGGGATWPTSNLPRSQDPTGSFHIEHTNATTDQLTSNLTKANLLLGNSAAGGSTVYSQLAFDISSAFTPNKHTANITVSKKQSTGTGHMSFRMYDESGNDNSTRPRVRIDGQGAIIMLSGSTPGAGAGWPKVDNSEYLIGTKMPSGSLTLVANKPGGLWNPPTLNLVTWGSNTHSSPAIVLGDSLGRIQWWSSDSQLTAESERVGAYIEANATANHTGTAKSPSSMSFFVRAPAAAAPTVKMIISPTMVMFSDDIRVGGDITVVGNNIKDSGAANTITFDGSANTKIEGDLTVAGNNIKDAGATSGITFDGSGNTKIDGELTLGDNVIKSLDGTIAITTVDSVGDVIVGGKLSTDFVKSKTTNITLDAAGDIILSADGDTITMDDGLITRFTFNLDNTPELDAQSAVAKLKDVQLYTTAAKERLQKFTTDEYRLNILVNNSSNQITNGTGAGAARRYLFSNLGATGDKNVSYWNNIKGFEVRNQSTTLNGSTSGTYKWQPASTTERFEQYNSMGWACPANLVITGMTVSCHGEHKLRPNNAAATAAADVLISIAKVGPTESYITNADAGTSYISDSLLADGGNKMLDHQAGVEIAALEPGTSYYVDLSSVGAMAVTLTTGSKIYMGYKVIYDSSSSIFYEYAQTGDATQTNGYATAGYLSYSVKLSGYYV